MGQYVIVHSMVDTGKVPYLYSNNDFYNCCGEKQTVLDASSTQTI